MAEILSSSGFHALLNFDIIDANFDITDVKPFRDKMEHPKTKTSHKDKNKAQISKQILVWRLHGISTTPNPRAAGYQSHKPERETPRLTHAAR